MQLPLGVGERVPEVTTPNAPLLPREVPLLFQTGKGALNTAFGHHKSFLLLQLASKVFGRATGPRATVPVQLTALGALTEHNFDPTPHTTQKQGVERVSQRQVCSHKKVAHRTAGSEGLTVRTRLARKVQIMSPDASRYLKDLRLATGVFLFGKTK